MFKERIPGEYIPTPEKNRIVKFVENTKNVKRAAIGVTGLALLEVAVKGDSLDKIQHQGISGILFWSVIIAATASVLEKADKTEDDI